MTRPLIAAGSFVVLLGFVALLTAGAAATPFTAGGTSTFGVGGSSTVHTSQSPPFGTPSRPENADCPAIQSNASLNNTYATFYNTNLGGNSALNSSSSANYPNISAGQAQLRSAWTFVCDSSAYQAILLNVNGNDASAALEFNQSAGVYDAVYGFNYLASCSDHLDFSSNACDYVTNWYVDLANGSTNGPYTVSAGTPLGTGPGMGGSIGSAGVKPWANAYTLIGAAMVALAVTAVAVALVQRRRRGGRTPPPRTAKKDLAPRAAPTESGLNPDQGTAGNSSGDPLSDVF